MATSTPSPGQLVLYVLLPIISFTSIVIAVFYCYRRKTCCFTVKGEALLGSAETKRFTVDMGRRKRRSSSLNSNSWESFESSYPSKHQEFQQTSASSKNHHQSNNNGKKSAGTTIISAGMPKPDMKRTLAVGQAVAKDNNRPPSSYVPPRRTTSPAQSFSDYTEQTITVVDPGSDLYSRHFSYDSSFQSSRRVGENLAYSTISEKDIPGSFHDSGLSPIGNFESVENLGRVSPSPRRLRHQGRVKNNEESFSRPTNQPRVSLVISAVDSIDLESSDESDTEVSTGGIQRKQLYSPSVAQPNWKKSNNKSELHPSPLRKSSSSDREGKRSPSAQYSGRSSPALLDAVNEENSTFVPRSPNIRSRSSPIENMQTSLDMHALQEALKQHRKSEGEFSGNIQKNGDYGITRSGHMSSEGLTRRERTMSQSSVLGGRRISVASPYIATSSLSVGKDSYQGRQGHRRSSMQMPIDLNEINPKLYKDKIKLSRMESEDPDLEGPQIHFTLDYNKDVEILNVKLIQATNLQTQAFSGTCDPYCSVAIIPGLKARQSKVHRRTTDPEFEEKFAFSIKQEDMRFKTLEVRTFDFDQFSRDECTGVMAMKLDVVDFGLTTHYDLWKKLRLIEFRSPESVETSGDLMLALSYLPSAEKLTVAIQKARNLNSPECRKGPPDSYVKVNIFRGSQRLKKKKTDTIQGSYNPVFNQALTFSVSPELLYCPIMRITCQAVHDQKLAANEELGYLEIGPGSKYEEELKHWRDVTGKHSNKPVARWHRLHLPEINPDDTKGSFLNLGNVRRSSSSVLYPQNVKSDSGRVSPSTRRSLT